MPQFFRRRAHGDPVQLLRAVSPSAYELVMRSAAASARQVNVQLDLARSMLRHAALSHDPAFESRIRTLLTLRVLTLLDLVERLPIEKGDRLEHEVIAVRDLLSRQRKG